jgi:acyl-CoA reductase-like NAD-dependent aldehyde dehydrogenase
LDAFDAAAKYQKEWQRQPLEERTKIFLRAAEMLAGEFS